MKKIQKERKTYQAIRSQASSGAVLPLNKAKCSFKKFLLVGVVVADFK